jgi:hypothetical protein
MALPQEVGIDQEATLTEGMEVARNRRVVARGESCHDLVTARNALLTDEEQDFDPPPCPIGCNVAAEQLVNDPLDPGHVGPGLGYQWVELTEPSVLLERLREGTTGSPGSGDPVVRS